ncbi:MAG: hypothetical protein ACRD96_27200, partial [Bryobacteraceae bacterium]
MDAGLQLALSMSVPTMAVLIGILVSNSRPSDLRSDFGRHHDGIHRQIDLIYKQIEFIRADLRVLMDKVDDI